MTSLRYIFFRLSISCRYTYADRAWWMCPATCRYSITNLTGDNNRIVLHQWIVWWWLHVLSTGTNIIISTREAYLYHCPAMKNVKSWSYYLVCNNQIISFARSLVAFCYRPCRYWFRSGPAKSLAQLWSLLFDRIIRPRNQPRLVNTLIYRGCQLQCSEDSHYTRKGFGLFNY